MGFFSRLANFFRMRANAALDKAEDPGQVMDYSYQKQLEQLQNLKRSIAEVVTNEKRLDHPKDMLQVGKVVRAIVLELDRERRRIRLGMNGAG